MCGRRTNNTINDVAINTCAIPFSYEIDYVLLYLNSFSIKHNRRNLIFINLKVFAMKGMIMQIPLDNNLTVRSDRVSVPWLGRASTRKQ